MGAEAMSSHTGSGETAAGGGGSKRRASAEDQEGGETSAGGKIPKLRFTLVNRSCDEEGEMTLKVNHSSRPLFVGKNKHIFLERFSAFFKFAEEFLIAIAEPVSRCEKMNEYVLTQHSLHAAVSTGLDSDVIIRRLNELSKTFLHADIVEFIRSCTAVYGKVKLVIVDDRFYLETPRQDIYEKLSRNPVIEEAKTGTQGQGILSQSSSSVLPDGMQVLGKGPAAMGTLTANEGAGDKRRAADAAANHDIARLEAEMEKDDDDGAAGGKNDKAQVPAHKLWHIEIDGTRALDVKRACLDMEYPCLEEYDFANDHKTQDLNIEARPGTFIRSYQEKSLSKMFSYGRARSGFIVLPCGAGKTLVGISAVANIKKCTAVICNTSMAVTQWKQQFMSTWTNVKESDITCFLSKGDWQGKKLGKLLITTYPMITKAGTRSKAGEQLMEEIRRRQWGLIVLDEVHLSFAETFWKVFSIVRAHCKLGLTATLVREDDKIKDLKNLIGPKLYEADWQDLAKQGYLARVQCVEVWCPMTPAFMSAYLDSKPRQQKMLWIMNPSKLAAVEFLVKYWEDRGHKIIVFSDDITAVTLYSHHLGRPCMTGAVVTVPSLNAPFPLCPPSFPAAAHRQGERG